MDNFVRALAFNFMPEINILNTDSSSDDAGFPAADTRGADDTFRRRFWIRRRLI